MTRIEEIEIEVQLHILPNKSTSLHRIRRMMKHFFAIAALNVTFISTAFGAGAFDPKINVGLWQGGAYTNDQSGEFSHCVAGAMYQSGINLMVGITREGAWRLGFANPNWNLTPGQAIPVDLTFDGEGQTRVYAIPAQKEVAYVTMPGKSEIIKKFKEAKLMEAFAQGNLFGFALDGTLPLFPALLNCVKAHVSQQEYSLIERNLSDASNRPSRKKEGASTSAAPKKQKKNISEDALPTPAAGSMH